MNHLDKFTFQIRNHLIVLLLANNILIFVAFWLGLYVLGLSHLLVFGVAGLLAIISIVMVVSSATKNAVSPIQKIQQSILHSTPPTDKTVDSPDLNTIKIGQELITSLVKNVYQLANVADDLAEKSEASRTDLSTNFIANKLPLPMVVLDEDQTIVFANEATATYINVDSASELIGQNAYTVFDMSFLSAFTLDAWLTAARKSKPVATQTWERVKLTLADDDKTTKLFDLAAYYNQGNPSHYETVLVLFDHTDQYSQDDQAMSFVALSVHELRTPLTLLRGYIEVFRDELTYKIDPEMIGFLHKMDATAQQLTYFVNNILNVARIEQTGLELELHEEDWPKILENAISDMELRASVRGMHITTEIQPNLPTIGADRISIYEVLCNLIDNALKYSGDSKNVVVKTFLNADGNVETTIEDKGVGIPSSSMHNLFDKFYRDHHKRDTIGGTGLGLYLSKIIIGAHDGHIWVKSKEGEGSTFGFTLTPYARLASDNKNSDNGTIVRGAHGWIKNHSLYRR